MGLWFYGFNAFNGVKRKILRKYNYILTSNKLHD